ncbi:hypothetical protein Esti_000647 [Eimeria stiedai]
MARETRGSQSCRRQRHHRSCSSSSSSTSSSSSLKDGVACGVRDLSAVLLVPQCRLAAPRHLQGPVSAADAERPPAAAAATSGQQQREASTGVALGAAPNPAAAAAPPAAAGEEGRSGSGGVVSFSEPPSYVLHDCAAEWANAAVAAVPSMHFAAAGGAHSDKASREFGGPPAAKRKTLVAGGPLPLCPGDGVIDQETNAFRTKPFFIRFSDETVPVSQVVTYRLELPFSSVAALDAAACVLQLLLLYSTGNTTAATAAKTAAAKAAAAAGTTMAETDSTSADPKQQQQQQDQQQRNSTVEPVVLAGRWLLVRNILKGVHAYAPVLFDCNASCLLEVLIFAYLLDVRVRLRPSLPTADLSVSPVSSVSAASSLSSAASALLYAQRASAERHYAAAIRATRAVAAAADRQQQQQQEQQDDDEAYWRSFKAHDEGDAQQQQQQRQMRSQRVRLLRKARGEEGPPQAAVGGGTPGTAGAPAWGPPGDWEVSSSLESFLLAAGRRLCEEDPAAAAAAAAALEDCSSRLQQQQQQRQKQDKAAAELVACAAAVHASCMRCLLEAYVGLVLHSSLALSVCLSPSSQLLLSPLLQHEDLVLPGGDVLSLSELLESPSKAPAAATVAAARRAAAAAAAAAQDCLLLHVLIPPTSAFARNGRDQKSRTASSSSSSKSSSSSGSGRHIAVRLPRLSLRVPFPCSAEQLCSVLSSDVHVVAAHHFGSWQRLCCALCLAQRGLLTLLRMEWEAFLCEGLSPFILHRTVPASPPTAGAAAASQQQQQQQQRRQKQQSVRASTELQWVKEEVRALGDLASLAVSLGGPRARLERAQRLLRILRRRTDTQQLADDWRFALGFLDSRLPDVLDCKLTTFVAERPVLFEETYCLCFRASCGSSDGWCGTRWCSGVPLGGPPLGDLRSWGGGPPLATRGYLPIRMHSPIVSPLCMQPQRRGAHLFVLVHGFQGTPSDFRIFKAALCSSYQHAACLSSTANADDTEGDIEAMGERLAAEVLSYVQECFGTRGLDRISFIGHSLGGIIVRAALPHLRASLGSRFHSYLSLSSPHFGYLKGRSRLVSLGLWVLKKWRKSLCLQQLTLSDSRDARQCLLYRLSRCDCLGLFKYVCLVASTQDTYAPLHSAAMLPMHQQETPAAAEADNLSLHNVSPKRDDSSSYSLSSSSSRPSSEGGEGQRLAASVPVSPGVETPSALAAAGIVSSGIVSEAAASLLKAHQRGASGEALSETDSSSAVLTEEGMKAAGSRAFAAESSDDEEGAQQQTMKQSHLLARLSRNIAARVSSNRILRLNVNFRIRDK